MDDQGAKPAANGEVDIVRPLGEHLIDAAHVRAGAPSNVPKAAKWLGAFGAVPFVALALAGFIYEGPLRDQLVFAVTAYGALILSFLGGVHWGLAIADPSQSPTAPRRLTVSVLPSLIGWAALLLPISSALVLLAAAFILMLILDRWASTNGEAPAWYPSLRWPLTLVVVTSLVVTTLAG